jgi:hypothetical protein
MDHYVFNESSSPKETSNGYLSLEPGNRNIRLLRLLPGPHQSPIVRQLSLATLDHHPAYETISYAWGEPGDTKNITVDVKGMNVPSNLEAALQHLRDEEATLVLWADSICINQQNESEKTHQVGMMGDIYRSCTSVYV